MCNFHSPYQAVFGSTSSPQLEITTNRNQRAFGVSDCTLRDLLGTRILRESLHFIMFFVDETYKFGKRLPFQPFHTVLHAHVAAADPSIHAVLGHPPATLALIAQSSLLPPLRRRIVSHHRHRLCCCSATCSPVPGGKRSANEASGAVPKRKYWVEHGKGLHQTIVCGAAERAA